ncbi:MAG: low temperature requirement protein A [Cyanobacteria bacterium J06632_22]
MRARDRDQAHRASTQLELLFDLVVVIAIAAAAHGLAHEIESGHPMMGGLQYGLAFFAIWWPWNLFTFFASSFDNDDVAYRLSVMVMMFGAMMVAASMPIIFEHGRLTYGFLGYIIFRVVSALLWLRVARANPHLRQTALRYSVGQIVMQGVWAIALFAVPLWSVWRWGWAAIATLGELLVPWYAEQAAATPWHRRHIIERFGLLNIIVLGEALLSSTHAITDSIHQGFSGSLLLLAVCGAAIGFSLWWLYFCDEEHLESITRRRVFVWGYGHFLVFSAGAAVGAGLSVMAVALAAEPTVVASVEAVAQGVTREMAAWAISIPLGFYVLGVWLVRDRYRLRSWHSSLLLLFAVLIILSGSLPYAPLPATLLLIICLVMRLRS